MQLIGYRVTNFRSVDDSGWINTDSVTSLIGVNESGKTNLQIPLWKLNPAQEGEIHPNSDYPKRIFGTIRECPEDFAFIAARFSLQAGLANKLAALANVSSDVTAEVTVQRYFDGEYAINFHLFVKPRLPTEVVTSVLAASIKQMQVIQLLKTEEQAHPLILQKLATLQASFGTGKASMAEELRALISSVQKLVPDSPPRSSALYPRVHALVDELEALCAVETAPIPSAVPGVKDMVLAALPKFVYYSNYGNLDSEIYLPHVVQNLTRSDLGAKEAAKARTLRVLFRFVKLEPTEILALGQDHKDPSRQPTEPEIAAIAEKKRERSILLQSAGTDLTAKFKQWWKQGNYRFRFEADGDHFRIWVSDDRRPEEIELESRSTGLQWFLSFYLVFLVESQGGAHKSAILLLDEPGLSLHPLAQRDLAEFFNGLAATNQIVFTTHSPFLVDANRLDRVRKVYVDEDGTTRASSDLRKSSAKNAQAGAAYAVYSALNLNISESLLLGCQPVVVEGPSDQHYLTAIKVLLISQRLIAPTRELVFPPGGGTKTLRITASILTGRDDELPFTLLDGDAMGVRMLKELRTNLYSADDRKLLCTDSYAGFVGSEVEDLLPPAIVADAVDRHLRNADLPFAEVLKAGPIVPQIELWAKSQSVELELGWKVEVAKRVKQSLLTKGISAVDSSTTGTWIKMFEHFLSTK
jgi:hypothetical protein